MRIAAIWRTRCLFSITRMGSVGPSSGMSIATSSTIVSSCWACILLLTFLSYPSSSSPTSMSSTSSSLAMTSPPSHTAAPPPPPPKSPSCTCRSRRLTLD